MAGLAALRISTQDGVRVVSLGSRALTLGRSASNDLAFPDDNGLSRQHLVFDPAGQDWWVRDAGSKNGTLLNSSPLQAPALLRFGDRIVAGRLQILFSQADEPQLTDQVVHFTPDTAHLLRPVVSVDLDSAAASLASGKAVLLRAGQELAGHRPLHELFPLVLHLAKDAVGAERAVLLILENGALVVRAAEGESFDISTTIRDRVLSDKTSLLIHDAALDSLLASRQSIVAARVRSAMVAPLQAGEKVTGLLYLDTQDAVRAFTQEDLNLLTVMANVAAIRLEHARLAEVERAERALAKELESAADIQQAFLPSVAPQIGGLSLDGRNLACRGVGGDYFDYFVHQDGSLSLVIADVAGKGMPAALMMTQLQAHMQALMETEAQPAEILGRLNRAIAARCPRNRFITCFIARLHLESGALTYANAGHNPPVLALSGESAISLEGGGPLLGIFSAATYTNHTAQMGTGDALLLYTDGVTEACRPGVDEEFGEVRLMETVSRLRPGTAASIVSGVLAATEDWAGHLSFADDVTIVAAKKE